jgi:hypothetical protein
VDGMFKTNRVFIVNKTHSIFPPAYDHGLDDV